MVLKRNLSEGEGDGSRFHFQESKRRPNISRNSMHGLSSQELASRLEPFIRAVVRDQVECSINSFCCSSQRSPFNQIEPSRARTLQLHFQSKLPSTMFTNSRIGSADSSAVRLVLLDAHSREIVASGPFSSVKIEIVPLDGDFLADDQEDWSEKDFDAKIVHEREGKRPLVTGDLVMTLKEGIAEVGDICFTDNSSWIRCRKFRLGAKVQNPSGEVRIREARSEAFVVKDHRGESYKKHHPPSLNDEIWRLEKIAKDGAFHKRLALFRISTVKDFLQSYVIDPSSLRSKLGGGISNKTWEIIIKHATASVLDDKLYMYQNAANGVELVFNSIFTVVGATFDGENYLCLDKLNGVQMHLVDSLKQQIYNHLLELVPIDETSIFGTPVPLSSLQAAPLMSVTLGLQDVNIRVPHQDQLQMQLGSNSMTNSPTYTNEVEDSSPLEVSMVQNARSMQIFSPVLRNSFIIQDFCNEAYGEGCNSSPSKPVGSVFLTERVAADYDFQVETPSWQGNGLCNAFSSEAVDFVSSDFGIHFSRNGKPKARWCKIRAAIKWVSVRREVAAKKMAKLYPYFDFYNLDM